MARYDAEEALLERPRVPSVERERSEQPEGPGAMPESGPEAVLWLQRHAGNAVVARLVAANAIHPTKGLIQRSILDDIGDAAGSAWNTVSDTATAGAGTAGAGGRSGKHTAEI